MDRNLWHTLEDSIEDFTEPRLVDAEIHRSTVLLRMLQASSSSIAVNYRLMNGHRTKRHACVCMCATVRSIASPSKNQASKAHLQENRIKLEENRQIRSFIFYDLIQYFLLEYCWRNLCTASW